MNKKIVAAAASVCLVFGAAAVPYTGSSVTNVISAFAAQTDSQTVTSGSFTYEITDSTAKVTAFTGTQSTLTIPSQVQGYAVTEIGEKAFYGNETLTTITIPDSVTTIADNAFDGCTALKTVRCKTATAAETFAQKKGYSVSYITTSISTAKISGLSASYVYTGGKITPNIKLTVGDKTLTSGTDYTLSFANNVNIGTASVTIKGIGAYTDTVTLSFDITAADISKATIGSLLSSYTYTGKEISPAATVTLGTKTLVKDTDYTVAYSNNIKTGTAKITVTGIGGYTGKVEKTYTIKAADIGKATVKSSVSSCVYNGKTRTPSVTVTYGSTKLKKNTDYTVSYKNNVKAGTATITVSGKGNYSGNTKTTFKIKAAAISKAKITGVKASYAYTGKARKPVPTVTLSGKKLKNGTDYTVSYKNNVKAGTATVTVKAKGNYSGTLKKTYKISRYSLTKCKTTLQKTVLVYNGKTRTPSVTVKRGSAKLVKNRDYTVSYKNNRSAGTATVTVKGKGNYTGTVKKTFKIKTLSVSKCKISGVKSYYKYLGRARSPKPVVKYGSITLKNGTDYVLTYNSNVNIGKASVTITGKGNYSGTVTKYFRIVKMGWENVNGNIYYYTKTGAKAVGLTTISGDTYYFDANGIMQTGWIKFSDGYYCFDRLNGKRLLNQNVDGIYIAANGYVQSTSYNVSKINTMMKAHNIMLQVTSPSDSMETKRLKCFKWVFQFPYHRFRLLKPIYENAGWEITFANDIFDSSAGCCVSEASAVAFLFREIGYENVYVAHDSSHAWVEWNGRVFDPLFAEAKDFNSNYNLDPVNDYRKNPVQRRMI